MALQTPIHLAPRKEGPGGSPVSVINQALVTEEPVRSRLEIPSKWTPRWDRWVILLMAEILHQLIGTRSLSHDL